MVSYGVQHLDNAQLMSTTPVSSPQDQLPRLLI